MSVMKALCRGEVQVRRKIARPRLKLSAISVVDFMILNRAEFACTFTLSSGLMLVRDHARRGEWSTRDELGGTWYTRTTSIVTHCGHV